MEYGNSFKDEVVKTILPRTQCHATGFQTGDFVLAGSDRSSEPLKDRDMPQISILSSAKPHAA
jgi:hypothetical protein